MARREHRAFGYRPASPDFITATLARDRERKANSSNPTMTVLETKSSRTVLSHATPLECSSGGHLPQLFVLEGRCYETPQISKARNKLKELVDGQRKDRTVRRPVERVIRDHAYRTIDLYAMFGEEQEFIDIATRLKSRMIRSKDIEERMKVQQEARGEIFEHLAYDFRLNRKDNAAKGKIVLQQERTLRFYQELFPDRHIKRFAGGGIALSGVVLPDYIETTGNEVSAVVEVSLVDKLVAEDEGNNNNDGEVDYFQKKYDGFRAYADSDEYRILFKNAELRFIVSSDFDKQKAERFKATHRGVYFTYMPFGRDEIKRFIGKLLVRQDEEFYATSNLSPRQIFHSTTARR